MKRIIMYTKDLMTMTGKSERYARYKIQEIKAHSNKTAPHHDITIYDVAAFFGIDPEVLFVLLNPAGKVGL